MLDRTKVDFLRQAFIDVVQELRQKKADADMGSFYVALTAEGRTTSNDAKLEFAVGDYSYSTVKAPALIPAFEEHMRRKGFEERHQALALPAPGLPTEPDLAAYSGQAETKIAF